MNILPKKRWHVRTKENIARVRKDEAEAAEQERLEKQRIENANREARLRLLKGNNKLPQNSDKTSETDIFAENTHINLFIDLEHAVSSKNKAHEEEKKVNKEDYEKKIGYLTYLGQDTNEALCKKNWYETFPNTSNSSSTIRNTYDKLNFKDVDGKPKLKETDVKDGEIDWKLKQYHDPLRSFKAFCHGKTKQAESISEPTPRKKNKSKKKNKDEKEKLIQKLREERLKREQAEKYKTDIFLKGFTKLSETENTSNTNGTKMKPKYNSQFNPELARQNFR